jgi:hypothetical protein
LRRRAMAARPSASFHCSTAARTERLHSGNVTSHCSQIVKPKLHQIKVNILLKDRTPLPLSRALS